MFNVAIIGAGIGAEHARGYATLPDRFRIHTICDLDEARAATVAQAHGALYSPDVNAVLATSAIDIIDVCLPPHLHFSTATAALDAGKHVVCEKPLVASLAEADKLSRSMQRADRLVAPVFQYRFGTGTAQLNALIDAGLAGRCYAGSLETHWDRPAAYYDIDWRGTWAGESGGAILGHAIHIHDLLPAILGPVSRVHAELATRVNDIEVEDCAALSIVMDSGALITSSVTLGCAENTSRLRLMFEGFTVESDHAPYAPAANPWRFVARAPTRQAQIDAVLADVAPAPSGFPGFFAALADALDGRPNRAVHFEDGRRALEFVTAVYASARAGMPVTLPIPDDHPLYASWVP